MDYKTTSDRHITLPPSIMKQSPANEQHKKKQSISRERIHELEREFFHVKTKVMVNKFMETTTAHGWGRVALEKNKILKFLWVILTLTAFGFNVAHVTALVLQYLSFPSEQVSEVELTSIEFPSVTVCNIQPMSISTQLELMADPSSQLYQWDNLTQYYYNLAMEDGNLSTLEELAYNRLKQPIGYFENIGDENIQVGHQPLDFILSCTFGLQKCTWDNFTFFQNPTYYNCYTFNGGNISREDLITRTTGPQHGLSLILYLESDNGNMLYNGTYHTLSNVGNAAGVRVMVHPPNTRPSPVDKGFDVPPGFSSSVGIKVSRYERLGEPYGTCIEDIMTGSEKYIYSIDTCISTCQQNYIMNKCGCVSSLLPIPEYNESNLKYCGSFDVNFQEYFFSNLSCEATHLLKFMNNESNRDSCGCHPLCKEYSYRTYASYSYWPLDFTQMNFYDIYVLANPHKETLKAYKNLNQFNKTEMIANGLIRKNFLRLNIYLEDLVIQEYIQKKSYEIQNLFSDMGGTFGLWIGMSIITWCEVAELLVKLSSRGMKKLISSGEIKKDDENNINTTPDNKVGPEFDPVSPKAPGLQDYIVYKEVQV